MVDATKIFFPYESIRNIQDEFMSGIIEALEKKTDLIVHAPTGLGKTVGALAPVVKFAIENELTILFLTSRHTQHKLAVDTSKEIIERFDLDISVTDLIGKKWMCAQSGVVSMYSGEFNDYCKKLKDDMLCEFYNNTYLKNKLSPLAKQKLKELGIGCHTDEMVKKCADDKLCPYEITFSSASKSKIIVADYYYVFHPKISELFFKRTDLDPAKCIVIVDEAHNLPFRIRDLASSRLTTTMIKRAIKEAKKFGYEETIENLNIVQNAINNQTENLIQNQEKPVDKARFMSSITKEIPYERLIADIDFITDSVREKQRQSYIGSIASFLEEWKGPSRGFSRYIEQKNIKGQSVVILHNTCLDASVVAKPVLESLYLTIMMSGILMPTQMYSDLMGFEKTLQRSYKSPFPQRNRLSMIIPKTTTKFSARSETQYKRIAQECSKIINRVPGNSFIFFPSYIMRDNVNKYFSDMSEKTVFLERSDMTKEDREYVLENIKGYKEIGSVLLGVASGSFSEGIDMPGDLLRCVIVVGLPLSQPDYETKELIKYYDEKFGKGWDYGYIFPAFNKSIQSAGRCIRSDTDKGIVAFID